MKQARLLFILIFLSAALSAQTPITYSKGANIDVEYNDVELSMLCGSSTKTVTVLSYSASGNKPHLTGEADQSLETELLMFRTITRPSGGITLQPGNIVTPISRQGMPNDSAYGITPNSTATMWDFFSPATNPAVVIGTPVIKFLSLPSGNQPTFAATQAEFILPGYPLTLHGTGDCLLISARRSYYVTDSTTLPVEQYVVSFNATWTEQ